MLIPQARHHTGRSPVRQLLARHLQLAGNLGGGDLHGRKRGARGLVVGAHLGALALERLQPQRLAVVLCGQ